jgi:hypothetical protein
MKIMYGLIGKVLPDLHTRAFSWKQVERPAITG